MSLVVSDFVDGTTTYSIDGIVMPTNSGTIQGVGVTLKSDIYWVANLSPKAVDVPFSPTGDIWFGIGTKSTSLMAPGCRVSLLDLAIARRFRITTPGGIFCSFWYRPSVWDSTVPPDPFMPFGKDFFAYVRWIFNDLRSA